MSDYEGGSKHNSRGSERESSWRDRERDRGQDREKDGGRYTREYKDRSGRFDRGRNSYNGCRHSRNEDFDRSRLRPSNGKEKVKLLEQAKRLYEDALDMDSNNVRVREALSSCMLELGSRRLYS